MNLLVTGGCGYIGSATVRLLLGRGHKVYVYDNLSTGRAVAVPDAATVFKAQLSDTDCLEDCLRRCHVDAVLHFAASALVAESVDNPGRYWRNNVGGSLSLFEAMVAADVRSLVVSSTCAVYGDCLGYGDRIIETDVVAPVSPYGRSKAAMEAAAADYARRYGWSLTVLRYFNAAGSDDPDHHGEDHRPETHLIPSAVTAALGLRPPLQIHGTDFDTADGTAVRDYVHVSDLADAHARAVESAAAVGHRVFNLGGGRGHSVREVVAAVEAVGGRPVPTVSGPRRGGDPPELVAAVAKAATGLGWRPKRTLLDCVESAWRWHSTHPNGYGG